MESEILVLAMFASFIFFLMLGIPIAYVLGGLAVIFAMIGSYADQYWGTFTGLDFTTLGLGVNRIYAVMTNWVLVALPMFIFMGLMLETSGVARRMMSSMQNLFGTVRGGLAVTVVTIGIILAASTGIIGASVVLLGLLSLEPMLKQNYNRHLALGAIASSGTLGTLIPPSIMLVIMADQMALSVGDLFMGAVLPGLLLGVMYILYILIYGLFAPGQLPLSEHRKPISWAVVSDVMIAVVPAFLLIMTVLGSIFAGIATPTEASGIGALGATLLALLYQQLDLRVLFKVLKDTFATTAFIFAIFVGATLFSMVLRELGGDELIEELLTGLPFGPYGLIAVVLGFIFLLGFFLDWVEITLIVLPLVGPIVAGFDVAVGEAGDNALLIWFVILVAITLQTSFLTPPVGFAIFYLKGICPPQITSQDIYKGIAPFVVIQLLGLAVVFWFPQLVLWLPSLAYQ